MSNLKIGRNDCFLMFLVFILHYFNNYVFWSGILTFWVRKKNILKKKKKNEKPGFGDNPTFSEGFLLHI